MKTFDTTDAIGAELDSLYAEVDDWGQEPEDARALNMKLLILRQRADLLKNHALEAKLDALEKMVEAKFASPRRVA